MTEQINLGEYSWIGEDTLGLELLKLETSLQSMLPEELKNDEYFIKLYEYDMKNKAMRIKLTWNLIIWLIKI